MIIIESYKIFKDSVESKFNVKINNNIFILTLPSNPLVDIDILKLHNQEERESIITIQKIIDNKLYSKKTIKQLISFKKWIYQNCINFNQINL